jgi:hypothetical protein
MKTKHSGSVLIFVVLSVGLALCPINTNADSALWNYSARGGVLTFEAMEWEISGYVVIDPRLRYWGGSEQPVEEPVEYYAFEYPGGRNFGYLITEFSMNVGGLSFSGQASSMQESSLYWDWKTENSSAVLSSCKWTLTGTGHWDIWSGKNFMFYPEGYPITYEKPPYVYDPDPYKYVHLAPIISFPNAELAFDYPAFDSRSFYLWLERVEPVPEPSLIVLLGISLMSIVGIKRWWKE